jgi:hypothetical protein
MRLVLEVVAVSYDGRGWQKMVERNILESQQSVVRKQRLLSDLKSVCDSSARNLELDITHLLRGYIQSAGGKDTLTDIFQEFAEKERDNLNQASPGAYSTHEKSDKKPETEPAEYFSTIIAREDKKSEPEKVNHPLHYNVHPSGIECITIAEGFNFNVGNAIKYLWRAGHKDKDAEIIDLQKAIFYLNAEIKRIDRGQF